jgi:RNA polymerase sigma-70 factor (ECF subfamily)
VLAEGRLAGYALLHAAHADLLERAGNAMGATAAWRRAAELTRNPAEQAALLRRAAGG